MKQAANRGGLTSWRIRRLFRQARVQAKPARAESTRRCDPWRSAKVDSQTLCWSRSTEAAPILLVRLVRRFWRLKFRRGKPLIYAEAVRPRSRRITARRNEGPLPSLRMCQRQWLRLSADPAGRPRWTPRAWPADQFLWRLPSPECAPWRHWVSSPSKPV